MAQEIEVFSPNNFAPAAPKAPGLLLFHGGGWRSGNRAKLRMVCLYFARRGMVAATADYRMLSKEAEAGLPAGESFKRVCVTDAKSAIRWMKQHARELGMDARRLVVGGGSAGGHMAVLATINPGIDDPADPAGFDTSVAAYLLFNPAFAAKDDDREVMVLPHLKPGFAPAIVFFGTEDRWLAGWTPVHRRLKELGSTTVELWTAKGGTHGFYLTPPWCDLTLAAADRFFAHHGILADAPIAAPPADGIKLELSP